MTSSRLLAEDYFPQQANHGAYTDSMIHHTSSLLKDVNERWSKVPRTYIVLRQIGHLDLLDDFIDIGFSDCWFPTTERQLPRLLKPSYRSRFVAAQELVLTKSLDLEKAEKGHHCYFEHHEPIPFERKSFLGTGAFGQVEHVINLISFRGYARKTTFGSSVFEDRNSKRIKQLIAEVDTLKRLNHRHVVDLVGSYTHSQCFCLIMSPVAEINLASYIQSIDPTKYCELRTFFGCLARALEYIHDQNIRHKNIKPRNILVDHGTVLLTDFGLSLDFQDESPSSSTIVKMINGVTARYCAPEAAMMDLQNTTSDIWSLGIVFLEMAIALKGRTVEWTQEHFATHGSGQPYVRTNLDGFQDLVNNLQRVGTAQDNIPLEWILWMLSESPESRPTSATLVSFIATSGDGRQGLTEFCGLCCVFPNDS